jgi:hypothetical protein
VLRSSISCHEMLSFSCNYVKLPRYETHAATAASRGVVSPFDANLMSRRPRLVPGPTAIIFLESRPNEALESTLGCTTLPEAGMYHL